MTTNVDALWGARREVTPREDAAAASTTTGGGKFSEPVVVWEANNKLEAEIVKGRLESEGIPAIIRGEVLGSIVGLTTGSLAATDVLVPAPLAEKALELLNSEVIWEEVDDGTDQ
ncbi:MAG: DUF2007 domain-containing protein [Caldilineaceae bacterium]|nr:DUF2007 domain-containing protein [Caldilineaceae bacterium]